MLLGLLFLCLRGGDISMAIVSVYVTLIIAGRRTYDQVPATIKPAVAADLAALGLDNNGQPIETAA
ncbi:hypothetical protein H7C19_06290 [Cohnella nanjingensis]|uniref:Uncharacterized protein n=1 Tax=Cohnella nanjingensis TaxID=1387779 RepID=A0A7X0RQA2_9BACL|nr:hypothetical protein [Cohnella nanjingensis]